MNGNGRETAERERVPNGFVTASKYTFVNSVDLSRADENGMDRESVICSRFIETYIVQ